MRHEVTIIGNNRFVQGLIESLIEDNLKPDLVVTLGPEGRKKANIAGIQHGLADWARDRSINVYECDGFRLISDRDRAFFAENQFGIGACTDWQHLIPAHVLNAFTAGIFGFHGSLMALPNGRGRSPFNWSIRLGGDAIFHNCFRYSEGADEGGVFNTTRIPIGPFDDIRLVQLKALVDYRVTIRNLLQCFHRGSVPIVPQPQGASVWLPRLTPEDSHLQFNAMQIDAIINIVRASSRPFAGAFGMTESGRRATLWNAARYDGPEDPKWESAPVGSVLLAALDSAIIKCRDGVLVATNVEEDSGTLAGERFL